MDFLDSLVLPQSSEHIMLLHYMLMLVFFLFIPFISIVFGGVALSVYFRIKGAKQKNTLFTRFANDLVETLTINKSTGIILGIVPVLTALLIYSQLLHSTGAGTVILLAIVFILNTVSLILIYTYRYSSKMNSVFSEIKNYEQKDEIQQTLNKYLKGTDVLIHKSAVAGIVILLVSLWLFTGSLIIAVNVDTWNDSLKLVMALFSWKVLAAFLQMLAAAFALTGGAILFAFFYWEGGKASLDEEYRNLVKVTAIKIAFAGAILQPVLLVVNLLGVPAASLSASMFGLSALSLILLFLAYNFLYAMLRDSTIKYSGHVFFALLFALLAVIVKDQLAMGNSTKVQTAILSANYDTYLAALKGTGKTVEISGEEVYQVRCSSCHKFDVKLVGPPYKQTMPKYEGKVNDLVAFILNPKKVNPDYPPMPNPGLKPNEAKAVAEYILKTYKTK